MSKQLPYYQFEVAEYLAGDVMICSLEAQGLFSIIKCLYWQKECRLNIKQILKRYDKIELIEELEEEGCLKIDSDGNLEVSFLLTQFQSFTDRRTKLSEAGKKGGLRKKEATLKPPLIEVEATLKHIEEIRGEKKIEEKRIVNNKIEESINSRKLKFSQSTNHLFDSEFPNDKEHLEDFIDYWTEHGEKDKKMRFEKQSSFSASRRVKTWIKNNFNQNNKGGQQTNGKQTRFEKFQANHDRLEKLKSQPLDTESNEQY